MPTKARYQVFIAVVAGHAVVVAVLLGQSAMVHLSTPGGEPISAFLVTRTARPRSPVTSPRLDHGSPPIAPIVESITLGPATSLAITPGGRAIDWNAAAKQAAAATLAPRKRISFGFPPGGKSAMTLSVPSSHTPAHYSGESDRTSMGEHIEWTSDRCYVESDPPVPGEPDFLRRARVSRSGCLPPDGPDPGELFKGLPAYRKSQPP